MAKRSFLPLYVTNFFGVINDNFLKTLAGFVVLSWLADERLYSVFMGVTAAALVVPYIVCSPLADRLTVVFSKQKILRLAKWFEIPIVSLAILGFGLQSPILVVSAILLMGLQSALYSPAKYALVRDIGGQEHISTGMGGMEGIAFAGVLAGTIAASFAADKVGPWGWTACLIGFSVLGLVFSCTIRAEEERNRHVHSVNPIRYMKRAARLARKYKGLNTVILTLSVFWWTAAMLQQGLIVYGKQVLGLDATHTGMMLALAAVGIVAGQVFAGFVDRHHYLLGATLLTGWIAAALLGVLYFVPMGPVPFGLGIGLLSFDLGFFKLPFDAEIQKVVKGPRLNTMLAYFNQVSFLFMFFASICYIGVSYFFGPRAFLFVLAVAMLLAPFYFAMSYKKVVLVVGRWIFGRRYKVDLVFHGTEGDSHNLDELVRLTQSGKHLLVLPNHPAMVDPMLVGAEFWQTPLRPLCDESFFKAGFVAPKVLRTLEAVPVPDLRKHRTGKGATIARGLGGIVTDTLAAGGNVIFYPSGHIYTENREDIGTRQLAYNICKDLPENVEVIGVRTTGLWGSIWSRKGRNSSPSFVPTFVKSVLLWFFVSPFIKRRPVTMEVENLTSRVKEWSSTCTRLEFNVRLTAWYNKERRDFLISGRQNL